jgi:hypothetical protein
VSRSLTLSNLANRIYPVICRHRVSLRGPPSYELSAAVDFDFRALTTSGETQEAMQASGPARAASSATFEQHFGDAEAGHGGFAFQGNVYGNINVPGQFVLQPLSASLDIQHRVDVSA